MKTGMLEVVQVNPAEFSPGDFAHRVRRAVEDSGVKLVVADSLDGYLTGMPDEKHMAMHMHELLTYLAFRKLATLLTLNVRGLTGRPEWLGPAEKLDAA